MKYAYKVLSLFLALALAVVSGESNAQTYPNKPIKLVVGFGPGGGTDILGRLVAPQLSERLGVAVTVENRPGANSNIGTDYVAKSAPDGYTLLVGGSASMALSSGLYERLPFDPLKDFIPIAQIVAGDTLVLAVHPSVPANSVKELIAYAKANPGKVFYGSGAPPFQIAAEYFNKLAGVNITHVPFKGAAGAVAATVAGETQMTVVSIASGLSQFKAGKLRMLAVTGFKRDHVLPDVPTMKEAGLAENFEVPMWTGLFAPAGTPAPIVDKLSSQMALILQSDLTKSRFATMGYESLPLTRAEFTKLQKDDIERWTKVVRDDLRIRIE